LLKVTSPSWRDRIFVLEPLLKERFYVGEVGGGEEGVLKLVHFREAGLLFVESCSEEGGEDSLHL